jgi:hypothetical protein
MLPPASINIPGQNMKYMRLNNQQQQDFLSQLAGNNRIIHQP